MSDFFGRDNVEPEFKRIFKNFASLMTSDIIARVVGAVVLVVLPRYLGPSDYGVYALALSYFSILAIFSSYGLDGLFIKDVSRDKTLSQGYFCTHILIKEFLAVAVMLVLLSLVHVLEYPPKTKSAILLLASAMFLNAIATTCGVVYRSYEKMEYNGFLVVSRSTLTLLGILIGIKLGADVIWMIGVVLTAHLVIMILSLIIVNKRFFRTIWETNLKLLSQSLKDSTPFFLVSAVAVINMRVDIIMLSKLGTDVGVGLFSAASELINILYIIPSLVSSSLFPFLSRKYYQASDAFVSSGNMAAKYLAIVGIPISVGTFFVADPVIELVYGKEFQRAAEILQILGVGVGILFLAQIMSILLTASDQVSKVTWINTVSLVVNVPLNFLLIPPLGPLGAALASVICTVIKSVYVYVVYKGRFQGVIIINNCIKPLVAAAVMGVILWWYNSNLVLTIALGVIIYVAVLLALKTLSREEIAVVRQTLPFLK